MYNNQHWDKTHNDYAKRDWTNKPSLFAETVKTYLPATASLLELGAGLGQDSAYFSELGYGVTATDHNTTHLQANAKGRFAVEKVDLTKPLPYGESTFEVVYAHLCLHYFDEQTTTKIFSEIARVLTTEGILAFLVNSTDDPEYNSGKQIEPDFFQIEGTSKRYFTVASASHFAHAFKPLLVDNNGETYKDIDKGVHNLVRFIGIKR